MKKLIAILLFVSLLVCAAGCAAKPAKTQSDPAMSSSIDPQGKVGISMPTKANERWIHEGDNMKSALETLGYAVDLQYAEDIVDTQVNQIENMLTGDLDVLVIAAIDGSTLGNVLQKAKAEGITVIAYDRLLTKTNDVDYYATFDSIAIGKLQATALLNGLGVSDGSKGPFHIELFAGSLDDSCAPLYFEGAMEVLQPLLDNGTLIVTSGQTSLEQCATQNWDPLNAQARMDNLISAYYAGDTRCDGVLSPYDGLSIGILSSFKAVGYGASDQPMPIVTGQDCELASVKSIINGEQYASIFNDTSVLSNKTVYMIDAILKGEKIDTNSVYNNENIDVPAMAVDAKIVTADNYQAELIDSGYISEAALK